MCRAAQPSHPLHPPCCAPAVLSTRSARCSTLPLRIHLGPWSIRMMRRAATQLAKALASAPAKADVYSSTACAARRFFADDASLLKTALYDFHVQAGGKCFSGAGG